MNAQLAHTDNVMFGTAKIILPSELATVHEIPLCTPKEMAEWVIALENMVALKYAARGQITHTDTKWRRTGIFHEITVPMSWACDRQYSHLRTTIAKIHIEART